MRIRLAKKEDLECIAQVYRDSIARLCANDYDQEVIIAWQNATKPKARQTYIDTDSLWVVESFTRSPLHISSGQVLSKQAPDSNNKQKGLAGFMVVQPGEIISLFIHPDYSGLGVGKKLAEIGIQMAKKGFKNIRIESTLTAVPFYQKLGFEEQSRGYFSHVNTALKIPVVNMTLFL